MDAFWNGLMIVNWYFFVLIPLANTKKGRQLLDAYDLLIWSHIKNAVEFAWDSIKDSIRKVGKWLNTPMP